MKNLFGIFMLSVIILWGCGNGQNGQSAERSESEILSEEILTMEQALYENAEPDAELANEMIGKYVHFANKFPNELNSAEYLFRAAEIAMNFNQPSNAVNYLTMIEENYLSYEKYATSIFLKAHLYDHYLKNNSKAEEYYQKFITEFPRHVLIDDAKAALMFLEMTDEQLVAFFEKMNL